MSSIQFNLDILNTRITISPCKTQYTAGFGVLWRVLTFWVIKMTQKVKYLFPEDKVNLIWEVKSLIGSRKVASSQTEHETSSFLSSLLILHY